MKTPYKKLQKISYQGLVYLLQQGVALGLDTNDTLVSQSRFYSFSHLGPKLILDAEKAAKEGKGVSTAAALNHPFRKS